jgi:hypothetical protein
LNAALDVPLLGGIAELITNLLRQAVSEAGDLRVERRLHEAYDLAEPSRHVVPDCN